MNKSFRNFVEKWNSIVQSKNGILNPSDLFKVTSEVELLVAQVGIISFFPFLVSVVVFSSTIDLC